MRNASWGIMDPCPYLTLWYLTKLRFQIRQEPISYDEDVRVYAVHGIDITKFGDGKVKHCISVPSSKRYW